MDEFKLPERCWYRRERYEKGRRKLEPWRHGLLVEWGTDFEEFEIGPGMYPVGIVVDDEELSVHSVYVNLISFRTVRPQD